jgi:hypothetical protein
LGQENFISPNFQKEMAKQKIMKFRKCNLISAVKNLKFHENGKMGYGDTSAQSLHFEA